SNHGVHRVLEGPEHGLGNKLNPAVVRLHWISRKYGRNGAWSCAFAARQGYVHHEVVPRHAGDLQQFPVERVVLDRALDRPLVTHEPGAMQDFDRCLRCQSGRNELAAAGKSQHQMGFDEPHSDVQVGCEKALVDVYRSTRLSGAEEPVLPKFARVVIDHTIVSGNKVPANLGDLRVRRWTMEPGGNQDCDGVARDASGLDPVQEGWKNLPVRNR